MEKEAENGKRGKVGISKGKKGKLKDGVGDENEAKLEKQEGGM
jgi:hypothetical protein